jgi:hypothetical protein
MPPRSLLLLLAVAAPGLLLDRAARRRPGTLLETITLPLATGTAFVGVAALAVVCTTRLTAGALLAAEAALLLPVLPLARRGGPHLRPALREFRRRRGEYLVLAALLAAACAVYEQPSEWVLSDGHDAANYLVQAAYHTRQPSPFPRDAPPDVYARDLPHAEFPLNSTIGPPGPDGRRQFPFPPFFKVLLAVALEFGGMRLALRVPLFLGLLAALATHATLARLVRRREHALIGTALLLGSPLLLQFMRVTLSEVCLLFVAATALAWLHAARNRAGCVLAGLLLSLGVLVRADGVLLCAGAGAVVLTGGLVHRVPGGGRAFGLALLCGSATALAVAWSTSSRYLLAHLPRSGPWLLAASSLAGCGPVLAVWVSSRRSGSATGDRLLGFAARAAALGLAAAATQALVVWPLEWLVRRLGSAGPLPLSIHPEGQGLVILGYATTATALGGTLGAVGLFWSGARRWLPWAGTFLPGALVYLADLHHSPAPYWASRRLLATVLPLFVAGGVFLLERCAPRGMGTAGRLATATLVAANLAAHDARLVVGRGLDYLGAATSLERLAGAYGPGDVVLVDGDRPDADGLWLGLRYVHGVEALAPRLSTVSDLELDRFRERLARAGQRLHVLPATAATARLVRSFTVEAKALELRYEHRRGPGRIERHRVAVPSLRLVALAVGPDPQRQ